MKERRVFMGMPTPQELGQLAAVLADNKTLPLFNVNSGIEGKGVVLVLEGLKKVTPAPHVADEAAARGTSDETQPLHQVELTVYDRATGNTDVFNVVYCPTTETRLGMEVITES